MNAIEEYYLLIINKKIVVGKRIEKIFTNLYLDMNNKNSKYYFDNKAANRVINFVSNFCKQSKGQWGGKEIKLMLFQQALLSAMFGFKDKKTKLRRFKEVLILMARKNGKTTLLSAIALYMLLFDNEMGAEVYSVATKKDQAKLTFTESVNIVRQSPMLGSILKKRREELYQPDTASVFKALCSDSNGLDGLNASCVIIDELHAIKNRELYEVMKQSMSARAQPMLVMITTAGTCRENIFDSRYDYAKDVADGLIQDETFLPILYELDEPDEWTEQQNWIKANPTLGTVKKLDYMIERWKLAKISLKDRKGILTKDFNIIENEETSWLSPKDFENFEKINYEYITDTYAVGGVDLSSTTDLTCASIIIMKAGDPKKYVLQKYFLPSNLIERRAKEDNIPYDVYEKQDLLKGSGEERINYDDVIDWFLELKDKYKINTLWVGYDRYGTAYWKEKMQNYGFQIEDIPMGALTLSQPMKIMAADFKEGKIIYDDNILLKICLNNTSVKVDDNDNIRPVKGKTQRKRIDGMMALLIAYTTLLKHETDYNNLI